MNTLTKTFLPVTLDECHARGWDAPDFVYVCGDADHMARDVHAALLEIARDQGGLSEEGARLWLDELSAQGRYARDVY